MMDASLRRQLVAALAASLTACGGGPDTTNLSGSKVIDSSNSPQLPPPAPTPPPPPAPAPPAPPPGPTIRSSLPTPRRLRRVPGLDGGSIAMAGDGTLWFSGGFVPNQIGRMSSAGAVSYPVTRAAGLMSFNPGPLTRGPDGNIWFADPLAGITLAGTVGMIDIATNVATEIATPLMKTTIQIRQGRRKTSHATPARRLHPGPSGTCVALAADAPGNTGLGPIPAVPPFAGRPAAPSPPGRRWLPPAPRRADRRQRLHDDDVPDHDVGPNSVATCTLTPPTQATISFASSAPASRRLAGLRDHDRPRRQPLVHRVHRNPDRHVQPDDDARDRVRSLAVAGRSITAGPRRQRLVRRTEPRRIAIGPRPRHAHRAITDTRARRCRARSPR